MYKKPYCKVCHDSGKPEREYTSHWVKDRDGKTLCPTLLNTECRYCFKLGHTAKFCALLEKKNKAQSIPTKNTSLRVPEKSSSKAYKKPIEKKPVNSFEVLECDDEEVDPTKEEYPALSQVKKVEVIIPSVQKTGWATIVAKPKEEIKPVFPTVAPVVPGRDYSAPIYTKSWADWSDSESDEEEEVKPWNIVSGTQTMAPGWSTTVADDEDW